MKAMVYHRKPSSINYDSPFETLKTDLNSRIRAVLGKRGIVYVVTALFVVLLYTLLNFPPKASSDAAIEHSLVEPVSEINAAFHGVLESPSEEHERPSGGDNTVVIPQGRNRHATGGKEGKQTSSQTNYGFPIVSTRNQGSVVMLTGATGPGHFGEIQDFYTMIVENRMEYAKARGTAHSSSIVRSDDGRLRFDDRGFGILSDYT